VLLQAVTVVGVDQLEVLVETGGRVTRVDAMQ
jgi:hypothetical protein